MLNIFIEDLGAKNVYVSVGDWITLPMKEEQLKKEIHNIFNAGAIACDDGDIHDEGVIEDYEWDENIPAMFSVSPYESVIEINKRLNLLQEKYDTDEYLIIDFLINEMGLTFNEALERIGEVDLYKDCSLADVAISQFDNLYGQDTDKFYYDYIDFDMWGRDLRQDCYYDYRGSVFYYNY